MCMRWSSFSIGWGLLACAALAAQQAPSEPEISRTLERGRAVTLDYVRSLPDFICTQLVRRYIELTRPKCWRLLDTLTIKLSYFEQQEDRKLVLINGEPAGGREDCVGGLVNIGEFGSMLETIFDPATRSRFRWESSKTLRNRPVAFFSYEVDRAHSGYMLQHRERGNMQGIVVAHHGVVAIDRETGQVLRLVYQASGIPKDFPIQASSVTVDYALAEAGAKQYLLPAKSETATGSATLCARNVVEFRDYHKFTADSSIIFGGEKE